MDTHTITATLAELTRGDRTAFDRLLPVVYDEMRRLAAAYLRRERVDHTLQPTALAHEAFLRLVVQKGIAWQNRAHFMGVAAQAMRRILVDHARKAKAARRGGGRTRVLLEEGGEVEAEAARAGAVEFDDLDRALEDLARLSARQARVVELRYFGGLSIEEVGEVLGVSPMTVKRDWRLARAWLFRELSGK